MPLKSICFVGGLDFRWGGMSSDEWEGGGGGKQGECKEVRGGFGAIEDVMIGLICEKERESNGG